MALSHSDIEQIIAYMDQAIGAMTQVVRCAQAAQAIIVQDAPAFQLFSAVQYTAFAAARDRMIAKRDVLRAKTVSISDI